MTSRIADTAASTTISSLPPSSTAVTMASSTSRPSWGAPTPITEMRRAAAVIPRITPQVRWTARCPRCPKAAPTEMTAAIAAKAGLESATSTPAASHASTAATAVCTIGSRRP